KESLEQGEPGEWKTDANGVWDSEKHDFVFLATPKEDTVAELEALIRWHENEAYRLPAPIAAAILFAEFESIHPFPDGNGRLGRLLNLWALKANGLKNAFLAPIDERFKRSQDRFYAALRTTNLGDSYSAYCGYYLTQLRAAFEQAQYLGRLGDVFDELPRASARGVLEWILSARADDWFKRGDYPNDEAVSDATLTTILSELTALGFLEAQGERKGRKYRLDWDAVLAKTERAAAR
ncbi:MAG: Fic family protein, partial [Candidatus Thermoplasmatota archaeon]